MYFLQYISIQYLLHCCQCRGNAKVRKTMKEIFRIKSAEGKPPEITPKKVMTTIKSYRVSHFETRTVSISTAENCKTKFSDLNVAEWLTSDVDSKGILNDLKSKYCVRFQDKIKNFPFFSDIFIHGSTNYRKPAAEYHTIRTRGHRKRWFQTPIKISCRDYK